MSGFTPEVEQLLALVGKPAAPMASGSDWAPVERRLSLEFPTEIKQLVQLFGIGPWADFLHMLSPFATDELLLERSALRSLGALHEIRRSYPKQVPYAVYPEQLGLFPWAGTDNGDTICWLTEGYRWPIVVFPPRDPEFEVHYLPTASFILEFLKGTLRSGC